MAELILICLAFWLLHRLGNKLMTVPPAPPTTHTLIIKIVVRDDRTIDAPFKRLQG